LGEVYHSTTFDSNPSITFKVINTQTDRQTDRQVVSHYLRATSLAEVIKKKELKRKNPLAKEILKSLSVLFNLFTSAEEGKRKTRHKKNR